MSHLLLEIIGVGALLLHVGGLGGLLLHLLLVGAQLLDDPLARGRLDLQVPQGRHSEMRPGAGSGWRTGAPKKSWRLVRD